jgi:RNA polymerase sigma factor (sigma-70 family)
MTSPQDFQLLEQLRQNERAAYLHLYDSAFPSLARYIMRNQGTREDSEDNFQECMMVLLQRIRLNDFKLQSTLKTYLFAINRNLWLKKLRDRKIINTELLSEEEQSFFEEDSFPLVETPEEAPEGFLSRLFENITGHCVILITRIFLKQQTPESLIRELGYKNAHTFQNQKYKCINQLRKAGKKFTPVG